MPKMFSRDSVPLALPTRIDNNDLATLLTHYDNKGLFALAAQHLKNTNPKPFKKWLERVLSNGSVPQLSDAIRNSLHEIPEQ